jgi:3-dehydroquinate synthase
MGVTESVTVDVALGERSYPVHIGVGLLERIGSLVTAPKGGRPLVVVTDETVAGLHLPTVTASLEAAGTPFAPLVLPPGESTKSWRELERLVEGLLTAGVERNDLVVALGGGVIGDLVGFACGITRRGVGFVQVPTTLLAQVDSSVGGKTAINARAGKNLVGLFHQPSLVLADTGILSTLGARDLRAGYAEVVKYGLLGDAAFFDWCDANGGALLAGDTDARLFAVETSVRAKAAIVAADERETSGARALLNLGHTFGHALEAECGFSDRLLHGEAVAIGMALAFRFSAARGDCPARHAERVVRHLSSCGLPTHPREPGVGPGSAPALIAHMLQDKKMSGGRLPFVLVRGIGDAYLARDVDLADVESFLDQVLSEDALTLVEQLVGASGRVRR